MMNAPMPNTDGPVSLRDDDLISAKRVADTFRKHIEGGMIRRRRHAIIWSKIHALLGGLHYFVMRNGVPVPIQKRDGEIRAYTPVMIPKYRTELGRFNANEVAVKVSPRACRLGSYQAAVRAQAVLDDWIEQARIDEFFDKANQHLLTYGRVGYLRYIDHFRKQVCMEAVPSPQLFPIPMDAPSWEKSDGYARSTIVSDDWLQQQDELYERRWGQKPPNPLARFASRIDTTPGANYMGFGVNTTFGGALNGANASWIWLKPTEKFPMGVAAFMVDEKLIAFRAQTDPVTGEDPLPYGEMPIENVDYTDKSTDWWPEGFLEGLVAPQMERNRQWSQIIDAAQRNRGYLGYNSDMVDPKAMRDNPNGLIPFTNVGYETSRIPPLIPIAPLQISPHIGVVMEMSTRLASEAANHESGIISGQSEGRIDSASGNQLLSERADAPVAPVFKRVRRAWRRHFPHILDDIRRVWPAEKMLSVGGDELVAGEILVTPANFPSSNMVRIDPMPMQANGTMAQVNMLMKLRNIPADDGQGFEIKSREFRRSLSMLGMAPKGIELGDKSEERILHRIRLLIGDGQRPMVAPAQADSPAGKVQMLENHRMAVQLLKNAILHPMFLEYAAEVQSALMAEYSFHEQTQPGVVPPNNFDDAVDVLDSRMAEQAFYGQELAV